MPENEQLFDQKPTEEPVVLDVKDPDVAPEPVKPVKKKRVISEKQRAQLAENLKRGRETSLKNRRAKKAANAAAKSGKIVAAAPSIDHSTDIKQLRDEVSSIKKERAAEKEQKRLRKLEKEKEKEELKKKKELEKEVKPTPEPAPKPDLKPEPVVVPVKPKPKVLTSRELMKLMDRL